ncbi:rho GTPase-activating protein 23 [Engraulis encrasicolus]|uniref:rho GTPase-activating protein 23 n=1 Tax=Engraulis encrasicolus TaxID=184585 RepID=UPI002FD07674
MCEMWTQQRRVSSCPAPVGMRWCFEFPVGVDCSGPEPCCIWLAALRSGRLPKRDTLHRRYYWAKGRRDGVSSANERARPLSGEGLACVGPRTVLLQKNSQGFGFTLRHFIVYPPESALQHPSLKDEENGNGKGCPRGGRLEPMDTIFVKSVREQGPAHQAGLCTGDRLVKVNGESVLGKTYSQVIALIQNSDSVLELSIMPKNEDVLQLAYSQDAYLKGNDPYTGGAEHLPEPPPICYPGRKGSLVPAPPPENQAQGQFQPQPQPQPNHTPQAGQNHTGLDNLNCRAATATATANSTTGSTPLDNRTAVGVVPPLNIGGDVGHRGAAGGAEDTSSSPALAVSVARQQQHPPPPPTTAAIPSLASAHQLSGSQHHLHHHHQPYRGRSSSSSAGGGSSGASAISPLDFHFANHNAAIASASISALASSSLPAPRRKGSLPGARSEVCHRALSDWYYSQAAMTGTAGSSGTTAATATTTGSPGGSGSSAGMPVSPRHRSVSQDRLADLGLSLGNHHHHHHHHHHQRRLGGGGWGHSASQDTLLLHYGAGGGGGHGGSSSSGGGQDSFWLGGWGSGGPASRSCSENLLAAAYEAYDQGYERSLEALEQASALISPRYDRAPAWPHYHPHHHQQQQQHHHHQQQQQPIRSGDNRTGSANHHRTQAIAATVPPPGRTGQAHHHHYHQQQKLAQVAQAQARGRHQHPGGAQMASSPAAGAGSADDQTVGYRSYSPSFCRKAGHLMQQSHSFRDPSYTGPHLNWAPTPTRTSPPEGADIGDVARAQASPSPPTTVDSQESGTGSSSATTAVTAVLGGVTRRGSGSGLVEEPMVAQTVSQAQSPATPTQTQVQEVVLRQKPPAGRRNAQGIRPYTHYVLPSDAHPDSPPSPSAVGRRAQPQPHRRPNGSLGPQPSEPDSLASIPFIGNAKNSRRSSYLLAITTERSKSCDEGLNTFREENRIFTRLPKRVKSFFTDGSLESLRAAEEARSKRHSTSELGNLTLTDIRKEGWLHYKQILTEKGKKVGGGIRPWKRVFSVLRSHSLFLYKDKREAVLHGAGAGSHHHGGGSSHAEDEQPINIRGCLIDIAYSETKRKHSLRLTTQDFCEYLLQAEDRDDMLGWIRVIRENSKTDSEDLGFSRQALINKKLNDYRKQSPTGSKPDTSPRVHRMMPPFLLSKTDNTSGTTRSPKTDGKDESSPPKTPWGINIMKKGKKTGPKAFGVRLEDCVPGANNKFVPLIVEVCCSLVEGMGLEYTGVYRVPGNNAMVSSLQEQLNKGLEINTAEEKWQDLNVISSLLKSFFRKLPEPLFTDDKYNDFIEANRLDETGDRLKTIRKLIHDLPDHYYHTLNFLVGHLKTVADHSEKNKMEPRNLALVFGPTLVRTSEDNMTDMVTHMPDRYKIIETLILHHAWFFSDELDKDEKTPEEQKDQQPIPNIDHLLPNIGRTIPLGDASDSTTSDSVKSKDSPASKKDLSAKDFLPLSIISAVTRKRKKKPQSSSISSSSITRPPGNNNNNNKDDDDDDSISTDDEDSEHEPIKAGHYGGGNKKDKAPTAEQEEDDDDEDEDEDDEEREGEEEEKEKRSRRRRRRKGRAVAGAEKRRAQDEREEEEGMEREEKRSEGQRGGGAGGGTRKQEGGERMREMMNQRGGQGEEEEEGRKGGRVRATAAWQGDGRPMEKERRKEEEEEEEKENEEDKGKGGGGGEGGGVSVPQARPPPPRSFLYRHARSSAKSTTTSPSAANINNTVTSPSTQTPTSPLYSPSSCSVFLPSSPTSPTSPFSQPGGDPPLTRKKLRRGERVRPHSMYSDSRSSSTSSTPRVADQQGSVSSPGGGGGGSVGGVGSPTTGGGPWWGIPRQRGASSSNTTQTPTPTIITRAPVFDYGPESIRVAATATATAAVRSPDWTERAAISTAAAVSPSVPIPVPVPSGQVGWGGGVGRRPPVSPETRRRRRDWRRHTVVVGLSGEG